LAFQCSNFNLMKVILETFCAR